MTGLLIAALAAVIITALGGLLAWALEKTGPDMDYEDGWWLTIFDLEEEWPDPDG